MRQKVRDVARNCQRGWTVLWEEGVGHCWGEIVELGSCLGREVINSLVRAGLVTALSLLWLLSFVRLRCCPYVAIAYSRSLGREDSWFVADAFEKNMRHG